MAARKVTKKKTRARRKPKLTRILTLDGGGIMGILPGEVLVELESILQDKTKDDDTRIADYFDLIGGTSTGGILAAALLCPDRNGRPKFTAQETVDIYLERGDEIFDVTLWQRLSSGAGVTDEKYDAAELEETLKDYFDDTRLSELLKPCLITAYDLRRRRAHFFTQHDVGSKSPDFLVRELCRATSAAPTYFEPARIKSADQRRVFPLIDGGVFANNPTMCAYAEARTMDFSKTGRARHPTAVQMAILSLGTGKDRKPYQYTDAKDWGMIGWVKPIIDILMASNADTIDYQLKQIFDSIDASEQYLRIDPYLGEATNEMDDARPGNLKALEAAGEATALSHRADLEAFADLLIKNA